MSFLHKSTIGCHGDLKSSNCLIDSRWVCKISDIGLEKFKGGQKSDPSIGIDAEYNGKYQAIFPIFLILPLYTSKITRGFAVFFRGRFDVRDYWLHRGCLR